MNYRREWGVRGEWRMRALTMMLTAGFAAGACLPLEAGIFHKKKYENPITKDTQQPDKVLFDKAVNDIEHGRYEIARITLNTLINTYDSSEFLAKAKLAIADSWYREGGSNGLAQAEAEYKDFILFYPQMQESAEAQNRICMIHYNQMTKADRDDTEAVRAEYECKQVIEQFPNSKYAPQAKQTVRNIQEALGEHEFRVGNFYFDRGANPAAANRLDYVAAQYPLYSKADIALFESGEAYMRMDAKRFRQRAIDDFTTVVRDYPLSPKVEEAKKYLNQLEAPIPEPSPDALARMKYNQENYKKVGLLASAKDFVFGGPDVSHASKEGDYAKEIVKPGIPVSVPVQAEVASAAGTGSGGGSNDVQIQQLNGEAANKLDTAKDARTTLASQESVAAANATTANGAAATPTPTQQVQGPLPSNHAKDLKKQQEEYMKRVKKNAKKKKPTAEPASSGKGTQAQPAPTGQPTQGQPASTTPTQPAPAAQQPSTASPQQ